MQNRQAKKRPPGRPAASESQSCIRLFSRNLSRRIQRAGIVDLGDLMIAEAQHLAQDFVGMFAQ